MNELITKVEQWAKDKGLDQTDSSKQMLKTIEEIGEVAASLARKDEHGLRDGIGDVVVTLIILAMQNDMDLYECLNQAYNEIKGRTGKMVDGVFVKSSDLKQLDEPKKLIVKPIVAGWIEKSTDFFTKAEKIAYLIKSKDGDSYYFCDWFVRDGILTQEQGEELLAWAKRQSYETLLSLYNGYEVEKE
ncbi:MazG-like family protein, partial [Enterococcus faecium]